MSKISHALTLCNGLLTITIDMDVDKVMVDGVEYKQDHDGCEGCRHEHKEQHEWPCCECKNAYMDKWSRRVEE